MFLALHGFAHSDVFVLSERRRGSLYINTYIKGLIQKDKEWLGNGSEKFFSLGSQSMSEELAGTAKCRWLHRFSRCPMEVVSPHAYLQILLKSLKSHLREPSRQFCWVELTCLHLRRISPSRGHGQVVVGSI